MISKALCLFFLVTFCGRVGSEVIMTVLPEEVIPGITPTFTLRCSAADVEPSIVSLQIKRTTQSSHRQVYETLATLNSSAINSSVVTAKRPGLTSHGMLSRLGIEMLPYLEISIANPSVTDLGIYVCDAMLVGELGSAMPISSVISVTTQDAVSDRVLFNLHSLLSVMRGMSDQMRNLQVGMSRGDSGSDGRGESGGDGSVPAARVVHIHVFDNISYVLLKASSPITADEAAKTCKDDGLYLTEINNDYEHSVIERNLGRFLPLRARLLIGGQRRDNWVWPHDQRSMDYMSGIQGGRHDACLILKKVADERMEIRPVGCEDGYIYYLCSADKPLMQ